MTRAYPIFFIHASVSGLVGCSHILAVVNNMAENEGADTSWRSWFQFFWINTKEWDCWIVIIMLSELSEPQKDRRRKIPLALEVVELQAFGAVELRETE